MSRSLAGIVFSLPPKRRNEVLARAKDITEKLQTLSHADYRLADKSTQKLGKHFDSSILSQIKGLVIFPSPKHVKKSIDILEKTREDMKSIAVANRERRNSVFANLKRTAKA